MLNGIIRIAKRAINAYETRRKTSHIRRIKARQEKTKRIEIYQQSLGCISLQEAQWIFQHHERWGQYYTFYLLMASTGMRACELVQLNLGCFTKDMAAFTYEIAKPKRSLKDREDIVEEECKFRTVRLDVWVREELLNYLRHNCLVVEEGDNFTYATPWSMTDPDTGEHIKNLLFPWKDVQLTIAYWWKLRRKMRAAGFDVDRMERLTTNTKGKERNTFVVRQHMWRGFACSIYYYQHGMDMKSTQVWIGHSKLETTAKYAKSAEQLGSNREEIANLTWAEITGNDMIRTEITNDEELLTA